MYRDDAIETQALLLHGWLLHPDLLSHTNAFEAGVSARFWLVSVRLAAWTAGRE
jgi:hypothetical protein